MFCPHVRELLLPSSVSKHCLNARVLGLLVSRGFHVIKNGGQLKSDRSMFVIMAVPYFGEVLTYYLFNDFSSAVTPDTNFIQFTSLSQNDSEASFEKRQ